MQCHRGLAGAGAALHHEDTGERRPDHGVLVGLDRGDDVAHARAAGGVEAGEQRALADDHVRAVHPRGLEALEVEHLVLHTGDLPVGGRDLPAPEHAARVGGGRLVEGLRGRRAPVDEQLVARLVGHAYPADVAPLAVVEVEAPEAQPRLDVGEGAHPLPVQAHERVSFGPRSRRTDRARSGGAIERGPGLLEQLVELAVEPAHVSAVRLRARVLQRRPRCGSRIRRGTRCRRGEVARSQPVEHAARWLGRVSDDDCRTAPVPRATSRAPPAAGRTTVSPLTDGGPGEAAVHTG